MRTRSPFDPRRLLPVLVTAVIALGMGWWLRGSCSSDVEHVDTGPIGARFPMPTEHALDEGGLDRSERLAFSTVDDSPGDSGGTARDAPTDSAESPEPPRRPRRSPFGDTQLEFGSPNWLQKDPYYNPAGVELGPGDEEELRKLCDVLNRRIEDAQALISGAGKQYGDSMIEMGLYEDLSSIDFSKGSSSLAMHGRGNKVVRYDPMEVPEVAQAIRDADDELQSARVLVQQFFEARR